MIAELAAQLDLEEVEAARRMPLSDKALLGEILFHRAVEVTRAGIRLQFPDADDLQIASILEERLQWRERQEQSPVRDVLRVHGAAEISRRKLEAEVQALREELRRLRGPRPPKP